MISNIIKYVLSLSIISICMLASSAMYSCGNRNNYDEVEFLTTIDLDSLQTEFRLNDIINGSYIAVNGRNKYEYQELWKREDLRYLPYIYLILKDKYLPRTILHRYNKMIIDMCAYHPNDSVYNFGKIFTKQLRDKYYRLCGTDPEFHMREYPERGKIKKTKSQRVLIDNKSYDLDSLRISVIGYNDHNAIEILEKYYKNIYMEKELAVYYKVMLGFEGNGHLAERYYEALKPYLDEMPGFYSGIKETLLRAALCDHNARAQQLCDSLGFSLCDYRLPRINE